MQQTVRLVLENGFSAMEPDLTQTMQKLWSDCPALFNLVLHRSEQDEDDSSLTIIGDNDHRKSTVLGCLQPKYCQVKLELPTRATQLRDHITIASCLTDAYSTDYNMPHIYQFGTNKLLWCKKLSFDGPSSHRCTFQCGDYIQYRGNCISRLDHILVHEIGSTKRRLFGLVQKVKDEGMRDFVLGLPILGLSGEKEMVGLPAIGSRKLYILPVEQQADSGLKLGGSGLLHVTWTVQFL